ncbi:hypothetical protein KKE48_03155 [Patescibacteria group bacterium]|nr:hypothetical protein [Patescibacteria group bacterium]MBU1499840.1 hypothetical protein [Patescibacteria group bacterium]
MGKEILFTIAQDNSYNSTDWTTRLEGPQRKGLGKYYDQAFIESYLEKIKRQDNPFSFNWYPYNAPGQWMAENINQPSTVITEPITLERADQELDRGEYGYLVIATYLSGYSTFREIAKFAHEKYPKVKVIAASVGALLTESSELADYQLKGSQVHDLRDIIGQPRNEPLKVVTVRSDTETRFDGIAKKASYALLISSLGCMYGCDICPSTAQFGKDYVSPFSAHEIKEAIIGAHNKIAPESQTFTVSIAEPQGLGNIRLWQEVFELCRDLPFQCELVSTTSSRVIQKYSIDELTMGALRLSTVNIGVESLLRGYEKNNGVDLKAEINRLQEAGINVVTTSILGLDWHTRENIAQEVALLKNLESSGYIVANLKMQPGTPLYNKYKQEGRLLDVPPELLSFYGYQSFIHPHFATGFNDMLPLLHNVGQELSEGTNALTANLNVFLKRRNNSEASKRKVISGMLNNFKTLLDSDQYPPEIYPVVDKFAAELYFHLAFRQMDLFHPYILWTH